MREVVISGSGYYHHEEKISNSELVKTFNDYVEYYNKQNSDLIQSGIVQPLEFSSEEFIENASGIKSRYVRDKKNLLNHLIMSPFIPERDDSELSIQAEASIHAAKQALSSASKLPSEINAVILSSSHKQRDFPGIGIEVQNHLGINGFAFDMGVACSSATFGIATATSMIKSGLVDSVLLVSPEIKSGQFCTRDRDSHFIFGEATSAIILEAREKSKSEHKYKICDISLFTEFSNNIRNNRGAYNNCHPEKIFSRDKFFKQNGRKVFKDVTKLVSLHILDQLAKSNTSPQDIFRFWLHQANIKMNNKIICDVINSENYDNNLAPEILSKFGNTSSSGSIIAFSRYNYDLEIGSKSVLCSFGAGYSVGSILLEKVA